MNIDSKKSINVAMNLPFALALAGLTLFAAEKLGILFEYGQFTLPEGATYESILRALLYGVFAFLGLLSIPRVILYMKGTTKRRWTFLIYYVVPFGLAFVLPDNILNYAWLAIAGFAWLEVLMVLDPFGSVFGDISPPKR